MSRIYCFGENMIKFYPRDPDVPLRDVSGFNRYFSCGGAYTAHVISSLGGRSAYIGSISRDAFGDYIRRSLRTAGVDLAYAAMPEHTDTPLLFVSEATDDGECKSYCHNPPSRELSPRDMAKIHFCSTDILHIEAAFLRYENIRECANILIRKAQASGCMVSIDACTLPCDKEDYPRAKEYLSAFLKHSLISSTAQTLSALFGSVDEARSAILENNFALLVLDGSWGPVCYTKDTIITDGEFNNIRRRTDENGAYLGGLLHALAKDNSTTGGKSPFESKERIVCAMQYAGAAAALACTKRGGILSFTASDEVRNIISKNEQENPINAREKLKKLAQSDYYRLKYHVMPECGWMNDPNGLVEYKGEYHAFFQHYPDAPEWGAMHWGHAVSRDLLNWRYLPIALTPDQPYEKGCFSGSAAVCGDELTLFYTAHDDNRTPIEVQCVATSTDGVHFAKYEGNPVISAPPKGFGEDFRDPKDRLTAALKTGHSKSV